MNLPFKLSLSSANPYGVLWNPWGTTVPNSVTNAILTNLGALQEFYSLLMRTNGAYWLTGFNLMGDTVDAKVSIGLWNTLDSAGQFDELYHITATVIAGGGIAAKLRGSGLYLPTDAQHVPVIKFTPVSGSVLCTGDLSLHPVVHSPGLASSTVAPSQYLQDEQSGATLTDEQNNLPLIEE